MKVSKIIKGIMGIGTVAGVVYFAYKYGKFNGENNSANAEKIDEDFDFYDEEDDEFSVSETSEKYEFAPLDSIKVDGISTENLKPLLLSIYSKDYISNKSVRDILNVDFSKANDVLEALKKAGYIGEMTGNYRYPVFFKFNDYLNLIRNENIYDCD